MGPVGQVLWTPSEQRAAQTLLAAFMASAPGRPGSYDELWRWSVDDLAGFWGKVWSDGGVVASRPYDRVVGEVRMPGTEWFPGARLNFAENLLRRRDGAVAVVGAAEGRDDELVSFGELYRRVARLEAGLAELGVGVGDRVAGLLPNCVETVVAMLATTARGAVWSSCSPDFGAGGVVDRFGQIAPKVLVTVDGYRYNGKAHALQDKLPGILEGVAGVEHVVTIDFAGQALRLAHPSVVAWDELTDRPAGDVTFAQLPPDHPLCILYSSGTTGQPKSLVHGAAGTLVKHLTEHQLHSDIRPGDTVFWYTTCGWAMWNWLVSALASEATIVCYDGSPSSPDLGTLWRLSERHGITHFGTSPRFLAANADAGHRPRDAADLSSLRAVLSTGSPLMPDQFDWVYAEVADDVQLASVSGGTEVMGCFVAGVPILPVRRGELQGRCLGAAVEAWDPDGHPVVGETGELVCTRPLPSMPVGFWNDPDGSRYRQAYFETYPGVWTHGDFIEIRPSGGVVIHGRSDTTLNPGGVRIGTAEIYRALEPIAEVTDAVVVGRPAEGDVEVVLCVTLAEGVDLDDDLVQRIRTVIRQETTPRHVPAHVFAVAAVPYTFNGKKVEQAVRSVIAGRPVPNRDSIANPEALDEYADLPFDDR